MNIYLLTAVDEVSWDETSGLVVTAESEAAIPAVVDTVPLGDNGHLWDQGRYTIKLLGKACKGIKSRVWLRDLNAG